MSVVRSVLAMASGTAKLTLQVTGQSDMSAPNVMGAAGSKPVKIWCHPTTLSCHPKDTRNGYCGWTRRTMRAEHHIAKLHN